MINDRNLIVLFATALAVLVSWESRAAAQGYQYMTAQYMTCPNVKAGVALVGEREAERLARLAGASEEHIAWAKRCLRSGVAAKN
jgi:hypothetical protein